MDSLPSDLLVIVAGLRESARRGDWKSAGEAAAALRSKTPPDNPTELGGYLHALKEAVTVARASRSHMAATLVRLNAVSRFNGSRIGVPSPRQEFGETAVF